MPLYSKLTGIAESQKDLDAEAKHVLVVKESTIKESDDGSEEESDEDSDEGSEKEKQ